MRRLLFLLIIVFQLTTLTVIAEGMPSTGTVEVFFSPNGGATDAITREIGKARQEILVQATRSPASL
jgi:hypothetical protein